MCVGSSNFDAFNVNFAHIEVQCQSSLLIDPFIILPGNLPV